MKIGFDISMTHQQKTGCAWFASNLSQSLIINITENEYYLYDHFIDWINEPVVGDITEFQNHVSAPLRNCNKEEAASYWNEIKSGGLLHPKPDIVHSNNFQACKLANAKLVYTIYDVSFWKHAEYTTEENRIACQQGMLNALRNVDGLVFISEHARNEFQCMLPGVTKKNGIKECVIHLGPSYSTTENQEITRDGRYWLMVGSLEPRKNHMAALEAIEMYWEKSQVKLPMKIVGGAGWKSEMILDRIRGLESQRKIEYLGYISDYAMPKLYMDAMGLLFPSWYEGFGLPVLEAMALGCPVITSNTSSLPEVGGDAVAYIDPSCPRQISEEMLRIEGNPQSRIKMIEMGHDQASKFSWNKAATQLMEFYKEIL